MIRNIKNRVKTKALAAFFLLFLMQSCQIEGENLTLGDLPNPEFVAEEISPGIVRLTNRTNTPTIARWTVLSSGQSFQGDVVEVGLIFAGSHEVRLDVVGQGGTASVTQTVNVSENDPEACSDDRLLGLLAGCTQKTWRYNPAAGALKVGPGPDNGEWWSSGVGDVTGRSCEFNDEFTFSFDAEGTFEYDNKGDFYADGYLGNRTTGCEPASNLSGDQALWNSGTFRFAVSENGGVNGLGQLRLVGKGAHIGVKKAHNGGETENGPVGDYVLYDVLNIERNVDGEGYDLITIGVNIGGDAWWSFTLRSFE